MTIINKRPLSFAWGLLPLSLSANQSVLIHDVLNDYTALNEVEVWSQPFAQKMGTQQVDSLDIERMPTGNGNVSELLKNNPNVQLSSNDSSSQTQGEIAPEKVSFHGERFYNNRWMIDGLSNNDKINPGSNNGSQSVVDGQVPYHLPDGGTQSFWINSELIERVDVYDSNISAKYGQFTGGVVDAKLRDPDVLAPWGSVSYRTTRDAWTNFHFENEDDRSDFEQANALYNQPKFTKQVYSFNVNQPLSHSAALLFSYNRTQSDIPFYHRYAERSEDQKRLNESYLLKGLFEADNGDIIKASFIYAPHESHYVVADTKEGNYNVGGGGYSLNLDWQHVFDFGEVASRIAYKNTRNHVEHESNNFYAWQLTDSIDWQSTSTNAQEGGFGETTTENTTLTLKQDYQLDSVAWGASEHAFTFGWKADLATARYERKRDVNIYTATGQLVPALCYANDASCIAGEQAADILIRYQAGETEVSNDHVSAYLQNQMRLGKWEFSAGLRADYDEYLGNIDVSPRLSFAFDAFGNNATVLFGGANRYYADSLLAYALSDKMGRSTRYLRENYDEGWILDTERTIGGTYLGSDMATPYSDELNLGINQRIGQSEWTFKWVNRKGRDQFVRSTQVDDAGYKTYELTNKGRSDADSFTLSARLLNPFEFAGSETQLSLGANYLKVNSSFTSYDPGHLYGDNVAVYAGGEVISMDELISRNSFNQPWTVFTNIDTHWPAYALIWSQTYRFTAGYRFWQDTGDDYTCVAGDSACHGALGNMSIYDEISYQNRFVADWRFSYELALGGNDLMLTLDVLNVFDSKVEGEGLEGTGALVSYNPGRRFWLGARYAW